MSIAPARARANPLSVQLRELPLTALATRAGALATRACALATRAGALATRACALAIRAGGRRSQSPGSEACDASASTKAVPSASSIACFSIAAPRDCLSVEPGWGGDGERAGPTSAWAGARNRRSNSSRSISMSACIPETLIEYSSATDCARPSEPLSQRNLSSPLTREIVSPEAKKRQLSPQNYVGDVKLLGSTSLRRL